MPSHRNAFPSSELLDQRVCFFNLICNKFPTYADFAGEMQVYCRCVTAWFGEGLGM